MNPAAKIVSISLILILIGIIGVLLYAQYATDKNNKIATLQTASSTDPILNLESYVKGRNNLENILNGQLQAAPQAILPTQGATSTVYSTSSLNVTYAINSTILRTYGTEIAKALKPYNIDQENEIALTLKALENNDTGKVNQILDAIDTNQKIIANLLKIHVPSSAISIHLTLLNAISQNTAYLQDMADILNNPSIALESADKYRVNKLAFYKAIDRINTYFRTNKITFSDNEGLKIYMNI